MSINFFEAQKDIEQFFVDNVEPNLPVDTPVFFDNVEGQGVDLWIRHSNIEGDSGFNALGRKEVRTIGNVAIQIFTPKGEGTKVSNETANLLDVYRGNCTSGIRFGLPQVGFRGVSGAWYQTTIYIDYYNDEQGA